MSEVGARFPPGKSGGLIEADRVVNAASPSKVFPPGKSGGLIEAGLPVDDQAGRSKFPPGKSGGLIEALTLPARPASRSGCFRRVNPAASLKQGVAKTAQHEIEGVSAG